MPDLESSAHFNVGDQVRLKFGARLVGTVAEVRGLALPEGRVRYRVRVAMSPEPLMLEVRPEEVEKA